MQPKRIENPIPYFSEAASAAKEYLSSRREHLMLTAEIRAKREGKRAALGLAALIFGNLTLLLVCFWISNAIHESGVSSWGVALICLLFFGAITATLAYFAKRHWHERQEPTSDRLERTAI